VAAEIAVLIGTQLKGGPRERLASRRC